MYDRMLIPVDGSEAASLELDEANRLAKSQGSTVRLSTVVDDLPACANSRAAVLSRQLFEILRTRDDEILADAGEVGHRQRLAVDTRRVEITGRSAGEFIVEEAGKWPVDLIVLDSDAEYVECGESVLGLLLRVAKRPPQA